VELEPLNWEIHEASERDSACEARQTSERDSGCEPPASKRNRESRA
jgi:hypothetical protein